VCRLIKQTAKLSSGERIFLGVNEIWFFNNNFCNQPISKSSFSSASASSSSSSFFLGHYRPMWTFTFLMDFPQSAVFLTCLSKL
jgi:hypothetical protein